MSYKIIKLGFMQYQVTEITIPGHWMKMENQYLFFTRREANRWARKNSAVAMMRPV